MAKKFASRKPKRPRVTMIQRSRRTPAAEKAAYNQPRRAFFGLTPDDEAAIFELVKQHIVEEIK